MTLTTSDWITIAAAIGQIAATAGAVVWQVKKTLPMPMPPDVKPTVLNNSHRIEFLRKYWASFLSITFGLAGLVALFWSSAEVDKLFIAGCIFFSFLCILHFLAILFFEFMRDYSSFIVDQLFTVIGHEKNLTMRSSGTAQKRAAP